MQPAQDEAPLLSGHSGPCTVSPRRMPPPQAPARTPPPLGPSVPHMASLDFPSLQSLRTPISPKKTESQSSSQAPPQWE